jgi:hypothetical protein
VGLGCFNLGALFRTESRHEKVADGQRIYVGKDAPEVQSDLSASVFPMRRHVGFQSPPEISSDGLRNRSQSPRLLGFAICHLRRRLLMVEMADSAALTEIPQDLVCITIVGEFTN